MSECPENTDQALIGALEREFAPAIDAVVALLRKSRKGMGPDGKARAIALLLTDKILARDLEKRVADEPRVISCSKCGNEARRMKKRRPRSVITVCGPMTMRRSLYRCRSCSTAWYPLDEELGLVKDSDCTAALREMISFVQGEETVKETSETLTKLLGFPISPSTVDRVAGVEGARAKLILDSVRGDVVPQQAPDVLLVEIDGCMTRHKDGWHETKIAVISEAAARIEKAPSQGEIERAKRECRTPRGREVLLWRNYVADAESLESFKKRLWREAERSGACQARKIAVIGDGALWIKNAAEEVFLFPATDDWAGEKPAPELVLIVDWYHAMEHVWSGIEAIYGNRGDLARARVSELESILWDQGDAKAVARVFREAALAVRTAAARETLEKEAGYFDHNASRMNYPLYRLLGLPVGSGPAEGACKSLIHARFKRPGMRWSRSGLSEILALRLFRKNHRWRELWPLAA